MTGFRHQALWATAAALSLGLGAPTSVMGQAFCHGVDDLPRTDSPIRSVRLRGFDPAGMTGDWGDVVLDLAFTKWDVPGVTFTTGAECGTSGDLVTCSIDCDGGTFVVMADGPAALVEALGVVYSAEGAVAPFFTSGEPDGEILRGLFRLDPIAGGGHCLPDPLNAGATLAAGDISPRVTEAERLLASLGYHPELPDAVFDARTATAVRAFQSDFRLPVTGQIDRQTALALNAATTVIGGC